MLGLEGIMLSEIRETEKDKYHMISFPEKKIKAICLVSKTMHSIHICWVPAMAQALSWAPWLFISCLFLRLCRLSSLPRPCLYPHHLTPHSWLTETLNPAESLSLMSDSVQSYGLQPARLLSPYDSPGKNAGVGCRALLQRIFPFHGSNLSLLCLGRQVLYH